MKNNILQMLIKMKETQMLQKFRIYSISMSNKLLHIYELVVKLLKSSLLDLTMIFKNANCLPMIRAKHCHLVSVEDGYESLVLAQVPRVTPIKELIHNR